jgi:glycosyltransferase involved in cell wall biosynthesis
MLSIIIPTLNEEKIIKSTLSLLKSRLKIPHELIVSDGGSNDKTVSIAKEYADKVVVFSEKNRQTIAMMGLKLLWEIFLFFLMPIAP